MEMKSVLHTRVLLGLVALALLYLCLSSSSSDPGPGLTRRDSDKAVDWKSVDLLALQLPGDTVEKAGLVTVKQDRLQVQGAEVFTQTGSPPPGTASTGRVVVLLHGAAFTSQTWLDRVATVRTLAALGHTVVAVDLPGYGRSKVPDSQRVDDRAGFLSALLAQLSPAPVVLVSPSMSGSYAVPLVTSEHADQVLGWVPVAPVSTQLARAELPGVRVPTMIVYGERDTGLGTGSSRDLAAIPTSTQPQILPGAGHPAYLDQPDLWHQLLYNFISNLP